MTAWHPCPNEPRCPHPGVLHDIEDYDDLRPMCCAEDCTCGKPEEPPVTRASDVEQFQAALAPLVDLIKRVRRENDEAFQRFVGAAALALHDATQATQEDFALAPPQPACPSVGDPKSPQVNGAPPREVE